MTAILSNSTRKLLWFEITKMLTAIHCNFRHTFVPNTLAGFLVVSVRTIIAKFHYTDPTWTRHGPDPTQTKSAHIVGDELNSTTRTRTPTRHGPDTDKVRARCRVRAKFHYTDPTRTRRDPHGPARTFFAAKLRWVSAGPVGFV